MYKYYGTVIMYCFITQTTNCSMYNTRLVLSHARGTWKVYILIYFICDWIFWAESRHMRQSSKALNMYNTRLVLSHARGTRKVLPSSRRSRERGSTFRVPSTITQEQLLFVAREWIVLSLQVLTLKTTSLRCRECLVPVRERDLSTGRVR